MRFLTRFITLSSLQESVLFIIYTACAAIFKMIYVQTTQEYVRSTLVLLTAFQAARPFQYRVLLPLIVHFCQKIIPLDTHFAYQWLTLLSTVGLFLAFRTYLGLFLPAAWCRFATLGLLYPLAWNYCVLGTYYYAADIPAILFFVLGLIAIYRKHWGIYYVIFILACLNRETSIFLVIAYLLTLTGRPRFSQVTAHVLAQAVIWLGIKHILTLAFAANPGEPIFENHWASNMQRIMALLHGDRHMVQVATGTFGAVWLLIPLAWAAQPVFFKRLLLLVIPFLVGMSIVGNLDEVRIYNELIPILLAPALFSLYCLYSQGRTPETAELTRGNP
jgi:hypothetical protein